VGQNNHRRNLADCLVRLTPTFLVDCDSQAERLPPPTPPTPPPPPHPHPVTNDVLSERSRSAPLYNLLILSEAV